MEGVMASLVASLRAWAGSFVVAFWTDVVDLDGVPVSTLRARSCEVCWPDWMSESGTLPVSSVCDTVVILARKGKRKVGGSAERVSKRDRRSVWPNSAMVMCAMAVMLPPVLAPMKFTARRALATKKALAARTLRNLGMDFSTTKICLYPFFATARLSWHSKCFKTPHLPSYSSSNTAIMPQNEYMDKFRKEHGRRFDYGTS
jgi:hypothetical protein